MGYFVAKQPRRLAYFLAKLLSGLVEFSSLGITRIPKVPTIANLIRAGDDLMYTSSMFDHIPPSPQEVCWVSLYTQFFNEMAWLEKSRTCEARAHNEFVKGFLSQADKDVDKLRNRCEKVGCDTSPQASMNEPSQTSTNEPPQAPTSGPSQTPTNGPSQEPMNRPSQTPTDDLEKQEIRGERDIQVSMSSGSIEAYKIARPVKRISDLSTSTTSLPKPPRSIATIWAKLKPIMLLRKPPKSHSDTPSGPERHFLYLPNQKETTKCPAMVCCVRDLSKSSSLPPCKRSQVLKTVQNYWGEVEKACRDIGDMVETAYRDIEDVIHSYRQPGPQNDQTTAGNGEENTRTQENTDITGPLGGSNEILCLPDVRPLWIVNSIPCIETSREELAGLALVMGINLVKDNENSVSGIGPFGIHLNAKSNFLDWGLRLTYQHRQPDHEASKGSGYSTLFAKHMACDSLPFKLSEGCVHSIYVNSSLLEIIRGAQADQLAQLGQISKASDYVLDATLKYLYRLPTAHDFAIYGVQDKAGESWFKAVAGIAFGGLVPQAGKRLTDAVLFTVTGIRVFNKDCPYCGRIIRALQNLVDALHNDCPKLNLFGNYVAKRARNGPGMSEADHSITPTSRHAGALFGRYMTALERLTAKSLSKGGNPKRQVEEIYNKCCDLLKTNYKNGHQDDLDKDVETVTNKITKGPIEIEDCGRVARCIIASWALRVQHITLTWDRESNDPRSPTPALQELPVVSAFGL